MTLVELLVALGLGLLVVLVATGALLLGQRGFTTVDASSQAHDSMRFLIDMTTRLVKQAGYQDPTNPDAGSRAATGESSEPDVFGWDNAYYATPANLQLSTISNIQDNNRPGKCKSGTGTGCFNGSDILAVWFQGMSKLGAPSTSDNTMVNCAGLGVPASENRDLNDRALSLLYIQDDDDTKEPSLMCSYWSGDVGKFVTIPLIQGVESFQVLYGTNGVIPDSAPTGTVSDDKQVQRWLRADQLKVSGDNNATRKNWRRVMAVRIGIVYRGAPGSMLESTAQTLYPLGKEYADSTTGTNDKGAKLAVPADRRLRQTFSWVINLPNDLGLQ